MRILMCCLEAPLPPSNGLRLQISALRDELGDRHDVRVLAFLAGDQRAVDDPDMRLLPKPSTTIAGKVRALPRSAITGWPLGVPRICDLMRGPLREELERFRPDVVHVTTQELASLATVIEPVPSILVPLDAWHLNVEADMEAAGGARRALLRLQRRWIRNLESSLCRRFARVVVVSERDGAALRALDPTIRIEVIPNGVDAAFFARPDGTVPDGARIVFTGVMRYAPNVVTASFLAREVMPRVLRARPEARLAVVGRDPAPEVEALRSLRGVEVTGEVPDIRPWLWQSRVYACPMTAGTGIKNKLLEAMAAGLPAVVTDLALRGMRARPGVEVLVGNDAPGVAAEIVRLLEDHALGERIGAAGRRYVLEHHTWASVARAYERLYEQVIAERVPG